MGLGQIRRERERLAGIRLRLVKAFTQRRFGRGLPGDSGKGDRSARERERIVRIQADRFRVRGNRGWEVFGVVSRAIRLGPAQIRIEGGRIARPAELDFGRDIAEQRDFQGAGHRGGNLGLKFQHIAYVPVIGLRPQVKARDRIDQLRGDADGVRGAPHAPFEHCAHVEFARDGADVRVVP